MKLSAKGAAFVRLHEGFVAKWYKDPVGIPTIGVGMTWRSTSFRAWWEKNKPGQPFARGATITKDEADEALIAMCRAEYGAAVNKFLGKAVPQHVFDAMVSVTYNCGARCLGWTWARLAKAGDYAGAAQKLRTTAVTAKGKRLAGLVRRRSEEAKLLKDGVYTGVKDGGKSTAPKPKTDHILKRGAKGEYVLELQKNLVALGYGPLVADGDFGKATEAAVKRFQTDHGLRVDGWAGNRTQAAIGKALEQPKVRAAEKKAEKAEEKVETAKKAAEKAKDTAERGSFWSKVLSVVGGVLPGVGAWLSGIDWKAVAIFAAIAVVLGIGGLVIGPWAVRRFKDIEKEARADA